MSVVTLESLRLVFKRVFTSYYLELQAPTIADPTEAFEACRAYLGALRERLGREEFMRRLDDETTHLLGYVEQDLRQRFKGSRLSPSLSDLEDRLRECFEHALDYLDSTSTEMSVE